MRQARHCSRSWHRSWTVIPPCLLALFGGGCAQPPYYYYGYGPPPCAPVMTAPSASPCDPPPTTLGPTTSSDAGVSTGAVASSRSSPRVVVSTPDNGFRLRLKRNDAEPAVASTVVEGAVEDTSVNR